MALLSQSIKNGCKNTRSLELTPVFSRDLFLISRYYKSNDGWDGRSASGAYVFCPSEQTPSTFQDSGEAVSVHVTRGDLVTEVHQVFGDWVTQTVRLYKDAEFVETEFTVGPIDVDDSIGKEIITRFDTNIQSDGLFYTDANGREMQERKINYRATWDLQVTEPVAGLYFLSISNALLLILFLS